MWSIEVKRILLERRISEQLLHQRGSSSYHTVLIGKCIRVGIVGLITVVYRHMADRLGAPYLQKTLNQVTDSRTQM